MRRDQGQGVKPKVPVLDGAGLKPKLILSNSRKKETGRKNNNGMHTSESLDVCCNCEDTTQKTVQDTKLRSPENGWQNENFAKT